MSSMTNAVHSPARDIFSRCMLLCNDQAESIAVAEISSASNSVCFQAADRMNLYLRRHVETPDFLLVLPEREMIACLILHEAVWKLDCHSCMARPLETFLGVFRVDVILVGRVLQAESRAGDRHKYAVHILNSSFLSGRCKLHLAYRIASQISLLIVDRSIFAT